MLEAVPFARTVGFEFVEVAHEATAASGVVGPNRRHPTHVGARTPVRCSPRQTRPERSCSPLRGTSRPGDTARVRAHRVPQARHGAGAREGLAGVRGRRGGRGAGRRATTGISGTRRDHHRGRQADLGDDGDLDPAPEPLVRPTTPGRRVCRLDRRRRASWSGPSTGGAAFEGCPFRRVHVWTVTSMWDCCWCSDPPGGCLRSPL